MSETAPARNVGTTTGLVQKAAGVVGLVFLLVGIAGFIPGLTSQYDTMATAGHGSMAMLLGIFEVSVLHNTVHLLFGVAGLAAARRWDASRLYFLAGGAIYIVLWLYGIVIDHDSAANFVPINAADNWLHLGLGVVMLAVGTVLGRNRATGGRHSL